MTLFDISTKNIRRNFKNYFLYFVSMVFSIMVYYTFLSIQYNNEVSTITKVEVTTAFKASTIVLAIFAAIFIWYSNSYFTKKRKREIGIYSLLGVKKRQIARMLFYETIVMGALALIVGIILGSLLSKLFMMILVRLMGYYASVKFAIVPKAIINTAIAFMTLFIITGINSYRLIYKFKLIELFRAEKQREGEPRGSIIKAIISLFLIGFGYFIYQDVASPMLPLITLGTLVLVVIGTFGLFNSVVIFIIKLFKKNKSRYYKGINMIGISQLLYRIKSNARTLATIAVLSATTLTAIGTIYSVYYNAESDARENNPFSFVYRQQGEELDEKVNEILEKYPKNKVTSSVDISFIKGDGKISNIPDNEYSPTHFYIISQRKYNEIASIRGLEDRIDLKSDNETIIVNSMGFSLRDEDKYTGKDVMINLNNNKETLNIKDFKERTLVTFSEHAILVVKDRIYDEFKEYGSEINNIRAFNVENEKSSGKLSEELFSVVTNSYKEYTRILFSSFYQNYEAMMKMSGLLLFIGVFLGLVFLIATGSIIYFKQLTDAYESKERYRILKNVGVSAGEVKSSVSKQTLFVFLLPLSIGIIHSLVALGGVGKVLVNINIIEPFILSTITYTFIYLVFYLLTVGSYNKIVNYK